jgi:hypothetical protein
VYTCVACILAVVFKTVWRVRRTQSVCRCAAACALQVGQAASAATAGKKQRGAAVTATGGGFIKVQGGSSKAGQTGIAAFLCRR